MKVKRKYIVGIMMLAIMLFFGLSSTAKAAAVIAYSGTITIANNATQSVSLGGDITITGAAADMVMGSTVSIACPSGLRFDTNNVAININSNVTCTGFTVSVFNDTGYVNGYKTDGTEIKLNVTSSAAGTIKFAGTGSGTDYFAVLPTAATATAGTLNVTLQTFTVTTNAGTDTPVAKSIGSISILEPPVIVSATLVSGTAADVLFSTNISGTSTALGANAADDTTDGTPVFLITTGNGTATAITTVSGTSARDASNNALVHITGITGTIYTGNEIAFQKPSGKNFTNALGAIDGPATSTAVPINPANPSITSVVIGNAPRYTGDAASADAAWNTVSTFTATVTATGSSVVKVRVPNGTVATTGITWTATGTDASVKSTSGGIGTMLMPAGGSTVVTATLSGNSLCATNNTVITGTVQASLDSFTSIGATSTSGDLIIDRKRPVITGTPTSPSRYSMVGLFSEDIDSTYVVPTGFKLGGDNSAGGADGANIVSVQLGSDKRTFTLTTNLLSNATNNTIAATTTIKDLAGNRADTTASSAFSTQGAASTKTSITGLATTSAAAGSMIISNNDTVSVTVEGPTGLASSVKARLVNGTTGVTLTNFAGTFTEYGIGQYRGTITAGTIASGTTSVKAQGTMDLVQYTESSESLTVDNTAPTVTSAQGAGTTAILVTFSEQMNNNVALTATASYSIIGSLSGTRAPSTTGIFRSPNQVVLQTTGTPTIAGETVIVDVAATDVRDLTFNSVSFGSDLNLVDRAQYTSSAADTVAPTISGVTVGADNKTVTATMTDVAGSAAVDISNDMTTTKTKVTQVLKGVVPQDGVITNNASAVQCIFTANTALENGSDYTVVVQATDLAGNLATRTSAFTVCGDPVATADPLTVAPGGTSTVSATGAQGPLTAAIATDTSGGATISGSGPWTVTAGPGSATEETQIVVTVTDGCSSRTDDVTITVSKICVLTVSATKSAVNGEKISVSASGGVLPYVYELTTATATGAAIDPVSGDYLAPAAGATAETETIKATDANGCSGTATVKISTDAITVTTTGSGTASVTISGGTGATFAILDGVGSVTGGVYTSAADGVGVVQVTKGTETAKVIIKVASGICTVESPVAVQDVNMDGAVDVNDLTPVIDKILE